MEEIQYIHIGRTKKVHGTEGELKVQVFEEFTEDFLNAEFLFLEIDGGKVPFAVENVRMTGSTLVLFEDLLSNDHAVAYTAKEIYLRYDDILKEEEREYDFRTKETMQFRRYEGFNIFDIKAGEVGIIKAIIEMPQQEMADIDYQGRDILIPMNDALIEQIDEEKRVITMDLPEGILEL